MNKKTFYLAISILLLAGGLSVILPQKYKKTTTAAVKTPESMNRIQTHLTDVHQRLQSESKDQETLQLFDVIGNTLSDSYGKNSLPEGDIHIILEALSLASASDNFNQILIDTQEKVTEPLPLDRDEIVSSILSQADLSLEDIKSSFGGHICQMIEQKHRNIAENKQQQ